MSKEIQKTELVNDLLAVVVVMEEVYKYHPDNKDRIDVSAEYKLLIDMKKDIERELSELDD